MSATTAVLRTEARLFGRELGFLFWILLFPTVLLVILGLVPSFREPADDLGGARVIDVYTPVSVLLSMIMAAIMAMPSVLAGYRERGVLRRLRATPVSPATLLAAQVALHAGAVVASTVLVQAVARLAFDVALPGDLLGWVLAYGLALGAALVTGACVMAVSGSTKVATALGSVVFFPIMFTAGVWVPVQQMPEALQTIVLWTPMGAGADALYDAAAGTFPAWSSLAVMAGWILALGLLAARTFRWE